VNLEKQAGAAQFSAAPFWIFDEIIKKAALLPHF